MREEQAGAREALEQLIKEQRLAVLSTVLPDGKSAYASLVAYAATEDLDALIFVTARGTSKHENLALHPGVCLLIDSRLNNESDFESAVAVTALGVSRETSGAERDKLLALYSARHPSLEAFAGEPNSAVIRVDINRYVFVSKFQQVTEFAPKRK
jgi:nitroimidazol reductase NimA-like FMN-containing flavoprotein (pyridoxamine 5'-phosphate oxidase superfamily)